MKARSISSPFLRTGLFMSIDSESFFPKTSMSWPFEVNVFQEITLEILHECFWRFSTPPLTSCKNCSLLQFYQSKTFENLSVSDHNASVWSLLPKELHSWTEKWALKLADRYICYFRMYCTRSQVPFTRYWLMRIQRLVIETSHIRISHILSFSHTEVSSSVMFVSNCSLSKEYHCRSKWNFVIFSHLYLCVISHKERKHL